MLFAIMNGVKTRLDNLAARLSAEEAAGDGAAMAQTIKEMEEIAEGRNELVKSQPLCQLRLMVSTFGTLVLTVNQGLLCESLMFICTFFLKHLTKEKKEGRDVALQIRTIEALKTMLQARAEKPLVVTIAVDGGPGQRRAAGAQPRRHGARPQGCDDMRDARRCARGSRGAAVPARYHGPRREPTLSARRARA
jgi:hypothetical protein